MSDYTETDYDELAGVLLTEFILLPETERIIQIGANAEELYQAKVRLYRLALVLMGLTLREQKSVHAAKVRQSLERLIFSVDKSEAESFLTSLRFAMMQLDELLHPKETPKDMTWAMDWLKDIGIDESNPVSLALFSLKWMEHYTAVVKSIDSFCPTAQ